MKNYNNSSESIKSNELSMTSLSSVRTKEGIISPESIRYHFKNGDTFETTKVESFVDKNKFLNLIRSEPEPKYFIISQKLEIPIATPNSQKKKNVEAGKEKCKQILKLFIFEQEKGICRATDNEYVIDLIQNISHQKLLEDLKFGFCSSSCQISFVNSFSQKNVSIQIHNFETKKDTFYHLEIDNERNGNDNDLSCNDFLFLNQGKTLVFSLGNYLYFINTNPEDPKNTNRKNNNIIQKIFHKTKQEICYSSLRQFTPPNNLNNRNKNLEFFLFSFHMIQINEEYGIFYTFDHSTNKFERSRVLELSKMKFFGPVFSVNNNNNMKIITFNSRTTTLEFFSFPEFKKDFGIEYPFYEDSSTRSRNQKFRGYIGSTKEYFDEVKHNIIFSRYSVLSSKSEDNLICLEYSINVANNWWRRESRKMILDLRRNEVLMTPNSIGIDYKYTKKSDKIKKIILEKRYISYTPNTSNQKQKAKKNKMFDVSKIYNFNNFNNNDNETKSIFFKLPIDCLINIFMFFKSNEVIHKVEILNKEFINSQFLWKLLWNYHFKISHFIFMGSGNDNNNNDTNVDFKLEYLWREFVVNNSWDIRGLELSCFLIRDSSRNVEWKKWKEKRNDDKVNTNSNSVDLVGNF